MSVHYYYGEDTYAAREAISDLAKKEEASIRWLDKSDFMESGIAQLAALSGGGLFGQDMIVIRDPSEMPKGMQDELVSTLTTTTGGAYILWDRTNPKKSMSVYKSFGKEGVSFRPPNVNELSSWLIDQAKSKNVELSLQVARLLVERVGLSRWELTSELEKLALVKDKITENDVKEAVSASAQAEIFAVLNSLARGEKDQAIAGINVLLEDGNSEFYILSMLAYQFRTLFAVRTGSDQGKTQFDVAKANSMKPYAVQKNWGVANTKPAIFWQSALTRVLATDFAIRQGRVSAKTGVLMLVLGLV
jgi:DNA polymerase III delta subunit